MEKKHQKIWWTHKCKLDHVFHVDRKNKLIPRQNQCYLCYNVYKNKNKLPILFGRMINLNANIESDQKRREKKSKTKNNS